jgi:hypothetical protein
MPASEAAASHAGERRQTGLLAIALLFVMQGLTGQFVVQAIPLFLREAGHPPAVLGLIYVAAIPYVARFLWAPLVDRYGHRGFGRRRSWVIAMQLVVMALLLWLTTLDPRLSPYGLIIGAALIMVALGTQLTAAGALMIELFDVAQYPRLASVQAAAAGLAGLILGAGVLFFLGDLGWQATVLGILAVSFVAFLLVLLEPFDRGMAQTGPRASLFGQFDMFRDVPLRQVLLLAIATGFGVALPYGMKAILQVDAGLTMAQIGAIGIVGGNAAGFAAALAIRPAVERWGGRRCLAMLALAAVVLCATVAAALTLGANGRWLAIGFVLASSAIGFAAFTAERSLAMPLCAGPATATRFATFVSLDGAAVLLFAALGNTIAQAAGLPAVFMLAAIGSVLAALWAWHGPETPRERTAG